MNKIRLIIEREYMTRVKRKSFLLTTLLVPVVIVAFYAIIIAVSISGESNTQRVAILDEANLFNGNMEAGKGDKSTYTFIHNETEQSFKPRYKNEGYTLFLYIPEFSGSDLPHIKLHSQAAVNLFVKSALEKKINGAVEKKRLTAANIDPEIYKNIKADIEIENAIDSGKGEKKSIAGVAYAVSFIAGILIYMILLIYGTMVMRGVMEEKTNRIAEVIVSSAKPFQLMLGKIIGIGAVGLTQFAIWIVVMGLLQFIIPLLFPDVFHQLSDPAVAGAAAQRASAGKIADIIEGIRSLPIALILFSFIFYFLGGYLLYAALFAAIGSVVSEDQQEAQQLVFPVMMPLILGFVIMTKAINDPDSGIAVFGSLFPLTSPIVMMGRVTYGVPWWQLGLSMLLLVLTFLFFTWVTAKIYRTGILLYGKKVTWREMWRWLVRKG
ncbi:ABC transporter permease [Agriterribacter sp.]|uniref:ABC transporter permease n=1 Tax=Agriterribacter sp. TaxID=2821509 RepID=UPI002BC04ECF|nr:ABC transporter permease [Agriterribacter sp.]HTN09321.1 ABC transporter permease [Agriterribacter sp.]